MRLTIWHKGTEKPVRDGVYQRLYDENCVTKTIYYCRFQVGMWFCGSVSYWEAMMETRKSPYQKEIKWRGITKDGK